MKAALFLCALILTTSLNLYAEMTEGEMSKRLKDVPIHFHNREIERIEIFHVPTNVLTRAALTPHMMTNVFHFKLIITDVPGSEICKELLGAIGKTEIKKSATHGDLRWGVRMIGKNENEIISIFVDRFGTKGSLLNQNVSLNDSLSKWLNRKLGAVFQ